MNAIHEIFDPALPRLAPGDDAVTRRALDLLFNGGLGRLPSDFRVLDVGCGNGSQTLCLARELGCRVTALDNHQPYLLMALFALGPTCPGPSDRVSLSAHDDCILGNRTSRP